MIQSRVTRPVQPSTKSVAVGQSLAFEQVTHLLWRKADLIEEGLSESLRCRRQSERLPFRRRDVGFDLTSVRGNRRWKTITRDLSLGGVGLFTRGFIYPGTRCAIMMPRHLGGHDRLVGRVAWCDHLATSWHHIGVQFDDQVFPKLYLTPDESKRSSVLSISGVRLSGPVVIVDPAELDRRLLEYHLGAAGAKVHAASSVAAALEAIEQVRASNRAYPVTPVLADLTSLARTESVDLPRLYALLSATSGGPVILLVNPDDPDPRLAEIPSQHVVHKPFTQSSVAAAVAKLLGNDPDQDEPIRSCMTDERGNDKDLAELLDAAVRRIRSIGADLQVAVEHDQHAQAEQLVETLRTLGSSFGYTPLTSAAETVLRSLDARPELSASGVVINQLRSVCRRVVR
ncbi:MAG: PilZ domain-containing protein [Planctomycetota bacterium]